LSPGDAIIVLFVIGPYLLLALFAWRQRGRPTASWVLLAVAVGMSAWGLYVFGEDSYRYHTEPQYRNVQRLAVFFVPLVQWAIVLVVGLVLLVGGLNARTKEAVMNWDQIAGNWDQITGNWTQFKGKIKEKWGKLTDDDLTTIAGKRDQLADKLRERYGYAKEEAERELGNFARDLKS
jgi:uncharacterized protein YjbJ (UPF0337 family)